jgi:hypothetical protein
MKQLSLELAPNIAEMLRGNAPTGPAAQQIIDIVGAESLILKPLDPGTRDVTLTGYFVLEMGGEQDIERIKSALLKCDGVRAAFEKPRDEPPTM